MSEPGKNMDLSTARLEQYARGQLSAAERHAIEKAALEDPFLADAIEGLEQQVKTDPLFSFNEDVLALKQKISQRRTRKMPLWWQSAAALLVLGVAGVSGYFLFRQSEKITPAVIATHQESGKSKDTVLPDKAPAAIEQETAPVPAKKMKEKTRVVPPVSLPAMAESQPKPETIQPAPVSKTAARASNAAAGPLQDKAAGPEINPGQNADEMVRGRVTDSSGNPVRAARVQMKKETVLTRAPIVPESVKNKNAFPIGGWKFFQNYVDLNKRITSVDSALHGEEIISFAVAADGRLSDFRIEETLSDAHDAEAERLIRSGPAWKISHGKRQRAVVVIKF